MTWASADVLFAGPIVLLLFILARRGRPDDSGAVSPAIRWVWIRGAQLQDAPVRVVDRSERWLAALAVLATLLALARPQWSLEEAPLEGVAGEVILALDLSRSMLAEDVEPTRLAWAKAQIERLADDLRGRPLGLAVFAGTAYLQVPLSADTEILREILPDLHPDRLPRQGSDLAALSRVVLDGFSRGEGVSRVLVVLSDGEVRGEDWRPHVAVLRARGIRVVGIGVGTRRGALIPDGAGGVLKDERGAAVVTRLEPSVLEEIARETGGGFATHAVSPDIGRLVGAASESKGEVGHAGASFEAAERFQWFLAPAIGLFLLALWRHLPVAVLSRDLLAPGSRRAVAGAAALCFLGLPAGEVSRAEAVDMDGQGRAVARLQALVSVLADAPELTPADHAALVRATLDLGGEFEDLDEPAARGVLGDARDALARGRSAQPAWGDWEVWSLQLELLAARLEERAGSDAEPGRGSESAGGAGRSKGEAEDGAMGEADDLGDEPGSAPRRKGGGRAGGASEAGKDGDDLDRTALEIEAPGYAEDEQDPDSRAVETADAGRAGGGGAGAARDLEGAEIGSHGAMSGAKVAPVGEVPASGREPARAAIGDSTAEGRRLQMERIREKDNPALLFERLDEEGGRDPRGRRRARRPDREVGW